MPEKITFDDRVAQQARKKLFANKPIEVLRDLLVQATSEDSYEYIQKELFAYAQQFKKNLTNATTTEKIEALDLLLNIHQQLQAKDNNKVLLTTEEVNNFQAELASATAEYQSKYAGYISSLNNVTPDNYPTALYNADQLLNFKNPPANVNKDQFKADQLQAAQFLAKPNPELIAQVSPDKVMIGKKNGLEFLYNNAENAEAKKSAAFELAKAYREEARDSPARQDKNRLLDKSESYFNLALEKNKDGTASLTVAQAYEYQAAMPGTHHAQVKNSYHNAADEYGNLGNKEKKGDMLYKAAKYGLEYETDPNRDNVNKSYSQKLCIGES